MFELIKLLGREITPELKLALKYMALFGAGYFVFITIYSIFFYIYVAKQQTQFIDHILWWLKLSGVWYVFAPLLLYKLTSWRLSKLFLQKTLVLCLFLVNSAAALQLAYDYQYYQSELIEQFILFLPKQIGICAVVVLYWYLFVYQRLANGKTNDDRENINNLMVSSNRSLQLEFKGRPVTLYLEDIAFIQSAGNYVEITTEQGTFLKRTSIKQMLDELSSDFCQCHRSYIVNLKKVVALQSLPSGAAILTLTRGNEIPLSKRSKAHVKRQLKKVSVMELETVS
ncbi:LytTR family DNA-binding domain-containing protein (plasmid) [Pseudoalteromonas sp. T1lg65]|uniref:LytTR family DNA-binding domain-containing protein n=1 Tax=Pseudoalteromonas sp. T1lg65 TaxID=2077101 RepID=UPI003F7A136D